jgi:uncharacterized membrane protein YeaQ/YmgE (transglycosylase-associated protein family)
VNGLLIGAFGRLLLPGRDPIGLPLTIAVGVVASILGALVTYGLVDEDAAWVALPISIGFAIGLVWLLRRLRSGRDERIALDPSVAPRRAPGEGDPFED